eukprot:NODE_1954_length_2326_cov_11.700318.p1 GENE.NODE_1954_length_2326_cov_11.700318~~NODE_1954_length_2326_cov_11.700318.p1  ORF type:complete len:620 (+),score=118.27 NODE_1954_length_2326_cov_11.700318:223-2082(+)
MLLYCNKHSVRIIFSTWGSIFFSPHIFCVGLGLAIATLALQISTDVGSQYHPELDHPYGIQALGSLVVFAVVFRTNLAWQRYWEAVEHLHVMYSKWADCYAQVIAFATVSLNVHSRQEHAEAKARCERLDRLISATMHNFSVMSAVAVDRLVHGDTERMEKRAEIVRWSNQVVLRQNLRSDEFTGSSPFPVLEQVNSAGDPCRFSEDSGSTSPASRMCTNDWDAMVYPIYFHVNRDRLCVLKKSEDRTLVVSYWIMHDLAAISGDLEISAPIQSRMYQELSTGMLGFAQATKLADVPFPFPFAQMLTILLACFSALIPFYVVCFTRSLVMGPIVAFLLFEGMWGFNELAKDMENPFGRDENDLPLTDFHHRFMDSLADVNNANRVMMYDPSGIVVEPTFANPSSFQKVRAEPSRVLPPVLEQAPMSPAVVAKPDPWALADITADKIAGCGGGGGGGAFAPVAAATAAAAASVAGSAIGTGAVVDAAAGAAADAVDTAAAAAAAAAAAVAAAAAAAADGTPKDAKASLNAIVQQYPRLDTFMEAPAAPLCDEAAQVSRTLDERMIILNTRMEEHLLRIAVSIDALSALSVTRCVVPFSSRSTSTGFISDPHSRAQMTAQV